MDLTFQVPMQGWKRFLPSRMVGSVAVAAWCWSSYEKISQVQWQRTSPSKMVGGANLHLESNPILARDAQWAQANLVHTRDPTVTELCLSIFCGGMGWWWSATETGDLGAADLSMA